MLETAVDHCIKAAGHEIDSSTQKLLIRVNVCIIYFQLTFFKLKFLLGCSIW